MYIHPNFGRRDPLTLLKILTLILEALVSVMILFSMTVQSQRFWASTVNVVLLRLLLTSAILIEIFWSFPSVSLVDFRTVSKVQDLVASLLYPFLHMCLLLDNTP